MLIIDNLILDIATLESVDTLEVKQSNENVNKIIVTFLNDGEKLDLTNCVPRLYAIYPNKESDLLDLTIEDAINGVASFIMEPYMLQNYGVIKLEFAIYEGEQVAITKTAFIQVVKGIFSTENITKTEYFTTLTDALNKVEIIINDETIYIPGPIGPTGKDGKSAYEIAVENGFQGTEEEWLDSLKGTGSGGSVDLSNYYTKAEVDTRDKILADALQDIADAVDPNNAELHALLDENIDMWR